jgi:cytochrome b561
LPADLAAPQPAYGALAKSLHWLVVPLVAGGFGLGLWMADLPISPARLKAFSVHKWIGVTVFALMLLRLAWRATHRPGALPDGIAAWQGHLAHAVHALLYALLIALPISGWMYSSATGVPTVPFGIAALQLPDLVAADRETATLLRFVHRTLAYSLAALLVMHVGAVAWHFSRGERGVLRRMLPGG